MGRHDIGKRYFPVTVLGSKVYADGVGERGPWVTERLPFQDEAAVELLVMPVGHRKVMTSEELLAILRESESGLPAIRVWLAEELGEVARVLWEESGASP